MIDRHLEAFIVTVETGSFSSAADQLYISRPALTQQMNLLEERLGFRLFRRSNRGVILTEAGRLFYDEAKRMLLISDDVVRRCKSIETDGSDTILIGSLPNFAPVVLPKICNEFTRLYPSINLQFPEYPLESYFKSFADGKFDITTEYMSGYMFDRPGYKFVKLLEDRQCCGVSASHPLARKDVIHFSDLRGQKLMLYAKGITRVDDRLREHLVQNEPLVTLIDIKAYNSSLPLKCELEGCVLIYYSMYWQSFPMLVTKQAGWTFPIDIGLGYRSSPRPSVKKFIELATNMFPKA